MAKSKLTNPFETMNFASSEAYKLLRTNIMFSFPMEKKCRIIGVTSSVRGEGKSTTSLHLAYSLAESGKLTLLIDADLRLPSIHQKLDITSKPGLSNLLAGMNSEKECRRPSPFSDNLYVVTAGDIPPNPSELLGSQRMAKLMETYSEAFDYIIVDLPPINIVTDALVTTSWADGLVLVVRENYTSEAVLDDTMYQIKKINAKLLGFVLTYADISKAGYGKYGKRYGGKYGKKYGYGYAGGYESSYEASGSKSKKKKSDVFVMAANDTELPESESSDNKKAE